MELKAAIGRRRMIRAFSDDPVDGDLIDRLLDLARRAPSAGNTQAAGFVVLDRPDLVARYWDLTLPASETDREPGSIPAESMSAGSGDGEEPASGSKRSAFRWQSLLDAPALILVTTEPDRYLMRYSEPDKARTGRGGSVDRWPVPYWWVDIGAVIQNLLLLATEAGLGACLFGPFDHEEAIKAEFGLPSAVRLAASVAIGHPLDDEPGRSANRPRPPIDRIILRPQVEDPAAG